VNAAGNAYIAGFDSADNYPVTPNALQFDYLGTQFGISGIFSILSPDGSKPVYSTYLGDASSSANGVAVDSQNDAYIVGSEAEPGKCSSLHCYGPGPAVLTWSKFTP